MLNQNWFSDILTEVKSSFRMFGQGGFLAINMYYQPLQLVEMCIVTPTLVASMSIPTRVLVEYNIQTILGPSH